MFAARKRCEQHGKSCRQGTEIVRTWHGNGADIARSRCDYQADPLRAVCTDGNGAGGACRRGSGRRPNGLAPLFETGSGPEHPVSSSRSNPNEETFEAQQRPVGRVRSGASSLPVGARRVGAPTGGARRRPGSFLGVGSGPEHPFAGVRRAWGPTDICRAPVRAPTGGGGGGGCPPPPPPPRKLVTRKELYALTFIYSWTHEIQKHLNTKQVCAPTLNSNAT